jgi:hypothetical protein
MLIINDLQKLDPSHVPSQPVTAVTFLKSLTVLSLDPLACSPNSSKKAQGVFNLD